MKKIIISAIAGCLLIAVFAGIYFGAKTPEIERMYEDSCVNVDDPRELMSGKDYVFVGKVQEIHDLYSEQKNRAFPSVVADYQLPFTECVVTVEKNLKGTLKQDTPLSFYKVGGVSKNGSSVLLYENDFVPEVGKLYIFTGLAQPDGTLTGGGTNGTIALEDNISVNELDSSAIVQKYIDAIEHQIEPPLDVPHYIAAADPHFADAAAEQKEPSNHFKTDEKNSGNSFTNAMQNKLDEILKRSEEYGDIEYIAP